MDKDIPVNSKFISIINRAMVSLSEVLETSCLPFPHRHAHFTNMAARMDRPTIAPAMTLTLMAGHVCCLPIHK